MLPVARKNLFSERIRLAISFGGVVFVRWQDILGITGATLLVALIAAFIPVRRPAQIDPVTVFKG